MTSSPTIIRASSLSQYADCPRRWAGRHLAPELAMASVTVRRLDSSAGAVVGSGVHEGNAYLLTERMTTGELGNQSEAEDRSVEELRRRISEEGVIWDQTSPTLDVAKEQVVRMVRAYRRDVLQNLTPISVEERLESKIDKEGQFILSGQSDVLEGEILGDHKTGAARRPNAPQYGSYTLLRRAKGQPVNGIREFYGKRVSVKKPQPAVETHEYDPEAAERAAWMVLRRLVADIRAFREAGNIDVFIPNPSSALCSDRYCPLHGTNGCPFHKH